MSEARNMAGNFVLRYPTMFGKVDDPDQEFWIDRLEELLLKYGEHQAKNRNTELIALKEEITRLHTLIVQVWADDKG